jgi:hypothetical protein
MNTDRIDLLREHLLYEHDMLTRAYSWLNSPKNLTGNVDLFVRNMAVEVFWLHARNLIEFYDGTQTAGPKASDFTAGKFQANFQLTKGLPADQNAGERFMTLINEQICHLKYERVSNPQEKLGGYDLQRTKEAIDRAQKKFYSELRPDVRTMVEEAVVSSSSKMAPTSIVIEGPSTTTSSEAIHLITGPFKPIL